MSVTCWPLHFDFTVTPTVLDDIDDKIAAWQKAADDKPVIIKKAGLPTSLRSNNSEPLQAQFVKALFLQSKRIVQTLSSSKPLCGHPFFFCKKQYFKKNWLYWLKEGPNHFAQFTANSRNTLDITFEFSYPMSFLYPGCRSSALCLETCNQCEIK
ncbi:hypothetical protein GF407_03540 [candidate division KSB1 bacterium]|nr:hypothetical protein [candidate division KSB1 bacterium]